MRREVRRWYSHRLNRDMDVVVYGHYGFAVLMIPSAASDCYEYEYRQVVHALAPLIEAGRFKLYVVNSINSEAWLNEYMSGEHKSMRHEQYNGYLTEEVVPFIMRDCNNEAPIYASGVSMGALLSANLFFRRPDLFAGTLAISGSYDLKDYTKGYFDERVFKNSPFDYLAKEEDPERLAQYRNGKKIVIATGQGAWERADLSVAFSRLLESKNIPHTLDIWGNDIPHDWDSWIKMYPYFLGTMFP